MALPALIRWRSTPLLVALWRLMLAKSKLKVAVADSDQVPLSTDEEGDAQS